MREIDIDISAQRSKAASDFAGQPFDVFVTTCDARVRDGLRDAIVTEFGPPS